MRRPGALIRPAPALGRSRGGGAVRVAAACSSRFVRLGQDLLQHRGAPQLLALGGGGGNIDGAGAAGRRGWGWEVEGEQEGA